jgi:hypothetical protein
MSREVSVGLAIPPDSTLFALPVACSSRPFSVGLVVPVLSPREGRVERGARFPAESQRPGHERVGVPLLHVPLRECESGVAGLNREARRQMV